jgi:hypothetical protein
MKKVMLIIAILALTSCTDATWDSTIGALNEKHYIEMYSGGKLVRSWTSTGKVTSESYSDGYVFRCNETDKLVRVSGDVVISIK